MSQNYRLTERDWDVLLTRINDGKCTPFLGAGVNTSLGTGVSKGTLPLGGDVARLWSQRYDYPLQDSGDLARVAQYLAVEYDPMFPKEQFLKEFIHDAVPPDFSQDNEPHSVLADLPLPVYMTTNYDDFMVQALHYRRKDPERRLCCWNSVLRRRGLSTESQSFVSPSPANPLVFHLHGNDESSASLVLTEDDYLDFLANMVHAEHPLPARIQEAFADSSLLFIGYGFRDWSFRVLFRGLVTSTEQALRRISVTVQLPPPQCAGAVYLHNGDKITGNIVNPEADPIVVESEVVGQVAIERAKIRNVMWKQQDGENIRVCQQEYLKKYFEGKNIRVYWGTASEFAAELRKRWQGGSYG